MTPNYPPRHISIRVPWHDTGWDGRVCANSRLDGSCLKLKLIAQNRDDAAEEAVAGRSLNELRQGKWPCCVEERVAFMAPFEYTKDKNHPYNRGPDCATLTLPRCPREPSLCCTCRLSTEGVSVALPARAKQKRIVAKVDQLLSLCDELEAKLAQAESASESLLSAAVHQLLNGLDDENGRNRA